MKMKKINKIEQHLREAIDLLDKKAPRIELELKIAQALQAVIAKDFKSQLRKLKYHCLQNSDKVAPYFMKTNSHYVDVCEIILELRARIRKEKIRSK